MRFDNFSLNEDDDDDDDTALSGAGSGPVLSAQHIIRVRVIMLKTASSQPLILLKRFEHALLNSWSYVSREVLS